MDDLEFCTLLLTLCKNLAERHSHSPTQVCQNTNRNKRGCGQMIMNS